VNGTVIRKIHLEKEPINDVDEARMRMIVRQFAL
jgi:hypothetical protein